MSESVEEEMRAAIARALPRGHGGVKDQFEFVRSGVDFATKWLRAYENDPGTRRNSPYVFVLSQRPQEDSLHLAAEGRRVYKSDIHSDLGGRLVVCNLNLELMYMSGQQFDDLSQILACIEAVDTPAHAFLVVYPTETMIATRYPEQSIGSAVPMRLDTGAVGTGFDKIALIEFISAIYEHHFKLPNALANSLLWENASDWKTIKKLELHFHSHLYLALYIEAHRYGAKALYEINMPSGRADLAIITAHPEGVRSHAIEIKALRQKNSAEANCRWAKWGVKQADRYRSSLSPGCESALTLVYDCRKLNDKAPCDAAQLASTLDVEFMHYPVFTNNNQPEAP